MQLTKVLSFRSEVILNRNIAVIDLKIDEDENRYRPAEAANKNPNNYNILWNIYFAEILHNCRGLEMLILLGGTMC